MSSSQGRTLTEAERQFLTRRHERLLWGQPHMVTPALVDEVFGDGQTLMCLTPTMHRPDYYVVQVDSSWPLDNQADGETFSDHLDEISDAIAEQFGDSGYTDHAEDCPEDCTNEKCYVGFPALNSDGCSWGEIDLSAEMMAEL